MYTSRIEKSPMRLAQTRQSVDCLSMPKFLDSPQVSDMNELISLPSAPTVGFEADEDAVREQLNRILASGQFRRSHRCETLLRYVVEQTLQGNADKLKERTIGVEAFQRNPEYDTPTDPVVRVTAGEVRKRLAQYYEESAHKNEIRIALPVGSYVPEVRAAEEHAYQNGGNSVHLPPNSELQPAPVGSMLPPSAARKAPHNSRRWKRLGFSVAAVFAALILFFGIHSAAARTDVSAQFWGKFLRSPGTALVSMGGAIPHLDLPASDSPSGQQASTSLPMMVAFPDMQAGDKLHTFLKSAGKEAKIQSAAETNLADLRSGPTVLVGGGSNFWTLELTDAMPYRFVLDDKKIARGIVESNSEHRWMVECIPGRGPREDYGIIARVHDNASNQVVVVAAGVLTQGTAAAGDLLTQRDLLEQIADGAPRDWQEKNLEAVFAVSLVNGSMGSPRIIAKRFW